MIKVLTDSTVCSCWRVQEVTSVGACAFGFWFIGIVSRNEQTEWKATSSSTWVRSWKEQILLEKVKWKYLLKYNNKKIKLLTRLTTINLTLTASVVSLWVIHLYVLCIEQWTLQCSVDSASEFIHVAQFRVSQGHPVKTVTKHINAVGVVESYEKKHMLSIFRQLSMWFK